MAGSRVPSVNVQHHTAEVNGLQMHWVEAGQGPRLFLLHPFPATWYCWRHQLPSSSAGHVLQSLQNGVYLMKFDRGRFAVAAWRCLTGFDIQSATKKFARRLKLRALSCNGQSVRGGFHCNNLSFCSPKLSVCRHSCTPIRRPSSSLYSPLGSPVAHIRRKPHTAFRFSGS